jgi:hypothetical protein
MSTLVMYVNDDRSSAVDRVGFDTEGYVYVRFKRDATWYKSKRTEGMNTTAYIRFVDMLDTSFGKWGNFSGLFMGMTKVKSPLDIVW